MVGGLGWPSAVHGEVVLLEKSLFQKLTAYGRKTAAGKAAEDASEAHWAIHALVVGEGVKIRCDMDRLRRIASDNWEKGLAKEFVPLSSR